MTLAELLIAGAIAGSSCCASVQVWGQAAKSARSARDLTDASALLERHWLASRRWLACAPMTEICTLEAEAVGEALKQSLPLAAGLERSLQASDENSGLWLVLEHPVSGLKRRQLITAAGLGGCTDNPELLNPVPLNPEPSNAEHRSSPTQELPS